MLPGLSLHAGFCSEAEQRELLSAVDAAPWRADLQRRVQHYGYVYDYKSRAVRPESYLGPLPAWVEPLCERMAREGAFARSPEQLIINEYEPGQGISAHVDCEPCFGPVIASLTLGSRCVMRFTREGHEPQELLLEPGSLLVLREDARYLWRHAIPARKSDLWGGLRAPRGRRVSLTFRTVRLATAAAAP